MKLRKNTLGETTPSRDKKWVKEFVQMTSVKFQVQTNEVADLVDTRTRIIVKKGTKKLLNKDDVQNGL